VERTVEATPRAQAHRLGPAAPRPPPGERIRLALVSVGVAIQIAWLTLFGWAGVLLTLLPLVLQGAPVGRRAARRIAPLHLFPAPATEDVAGP